MDGLRNSARGDGNGEILLGPRSQRTRDVIDRWETIAKYWAEVTAHLGKKRSDVERLRKTRNTV